MNIHHLELFYYVARHGGISAAARKMPYGIQQPAISAQILRLEDDLGRTLFQRRPFRLTGEGEELFRFIEPFFSGLAEAGRRLRGGEEARLAIGAQEMILRDYLPPILASLRERVAAFSFTLHPLRLDEIEAQLLGQQIDIGLAQLDGKRPEGVNQRVLVELPLRLLVPAGSALKSAASLWKRNRITEPLICLPASTPMVRAFQRALDERGVAWPPSLELPTLDLVARYTAEGYGIGLTTLPPRAEAPAGTRFVGLPGFPLLPVGVVWLGTLSPLERMFVEETEAFARRLDGAE